ncbi:MAG: stage II sporulation protein P, partial [Oscillibacter sp.]|nr:stage II sporulation protein P [Oscillibacter sp.]
ADGAGVVWSGESRSTDPRVGVVRMGDAMAEELGALGVSVLHDRTLYDYPQYAGSYDRSLAAIEKHFADYPSLSIVLDVHRDALTGADGEPIKLVSPADGGAAAQLAFVVGSDGSGLPHPNWLENLRFAAALGNRIAADYPTLLRPITLRSSRYNQHVSPGALLVEVGTAGNSPEEAERAARIFARELAALLSEQ